MAIKMKKAVIIGGGVSGLTAGIYLQKAGMQTEIYEKHTVAGGLCTGWKREGFFIDNCVHWLMGPGGLPVAATMGKFAAQRVMKAERMEY